jgi:hypothetical protein
MKSSLRGLSSCLTGAMFVAFALLSPNCQPSGGELNTGGNGGNGDNGGSGSGGSGSGGNASGGSSGSGGSTTGNGGSTTGNGGKTGSGGSTTGNGGKTGSGGSTTGNGGKTGSGGSTTGNGGKTGSGGSTTGNGGVTGNGGATTSNGGTTGSSTTNTGTTVVFGAGKGQGAMTGYGYVALGAADTITSPTCGASAAPITKAAPCKSDPNWSKTDALCISGSVPVLAATDPDYTGNWGVSVGVNAGDPDTVTLGQSFTSVAITVTGSPSSGLRAIVHRKGDPEDTQYCLAYASGAMALTSFSLTCYDSASPGTKITTADIPNINKVAVQVTSNQTAAITVTDLCITKIEFAK